MTLLCRCPGKMSGSSVQRLCQSLASLGSAGRGGISMCWCAGCQLVSSSRLRVAYPMLSSLATLLRHINPRSRRSPTAAAGAWHANSHQHPPHRGPRQHNAFPFRKQLRQVCMVHIAVALLHKSYHPLASLPRGCTSGHPATVAMSSSSDAFLSISRQESPRMAFAHPENHRSLPHCPRPSSTPFNTTHTCSFVVNVSPLID